MNIDSNCSDKEIASLAKEIVAENINLIEGVRKMLSLLNQADGVATETSNVFRGVDSQTDHFVLSPINNNLSDEARLRNTAELRESQNYFRSAIFEACHRILAERGK